MGFLGFGKDLTFYHLLERQAALTCRAAEAFRDMVRDLPSAAEHARRIQALDDEADAVIRDLAGRVASTFITPLDKEDLLPLGYVLDNWVDGINGLAARVALYRLPRPRPDFETLAELLVQAVTTVHNGVIQLRHSPSYEEIADLLARIHQLRSDGDQRAREALAALFAEETLDPRELHKWENLFERAKSVIDRCAEMAIHLEILAVKYA